MDINIAEYAEPNWDGHGADPIKAETIEFAQALNALFSKPPHWAPGADGSIGFEWLDFKNDRKIYVDVSSDHISIYARVGARKLKSPIAGLAEATANRERMLCLSCGTVTRAPVAK